MRAWTSVLFAWACLFLALGVGPAAPWLAGLLCVVGFVGGVIPPAQPEQAPQRRRQASGQSLPSDLGRQPEAGSSNP